LFPAHTDFSEGRWFCAPEGTQQVSSHITNVQQGASETGAASSQVLSAAKSLSGDSNRLKLEVGKFLNTVRAA
jgi:methyl-accepting chemotaxis protein